MIKIVVGNMFDYPSTYLLVGSNIRGHCESKTSLMSQALPYLKDEELLEYKEDSKTVSKYGDVLTYYMKDNAPFTGLLIGFPGTGHPESFEQMIVNTIASVNILGFMGTASGITMPLVGHSKTGLTLDEWVTGFNNAIARLTEKHTKGQLFVGDITIVCKTQEQANYLNKTILPYPEV
ncbi:MAG: hypothetical protein WA440_03855 [Ignavibacteriaceae bacterium]